MGGPAAGQGDGLAGGRSHKDRPAPRRVTGKGYADKAAVIAAVRARGFSPADDNEADALAILLWAIETQGGVR
jgi:Holliday junction resolvasome RuvABC endonuclease subunit